MRARPPSYRSSFAHEPCEAANNTLFGPDLPELPPPVQVCPKLGKSLPEAKINMCTATTRPKEVARPRLRAYPTGLDETFPMSYQRQVGWHFWPRSTRCHIPLTRSLVSDSVLNFAHFSLVTLSDDPCAIVLVLLRFRVDQGFNLSYQWPPESVLRLKNQDSVESDILRSTTRRAPSLILFILKFYFLSAFSPDC